MTSGIHGRRRHEFTQFWFINIEWYLNTVPVGSISPWMHDINTLVNSFAVHRILLPSSRYSGRSRASSQVTYFSSPDVSNLPHTTRLQTTSKPLLSRERNENYCIICGMSGCLTAYQSSHFESYLVFRRHSDEERYIKAIADKPKCNTPSPNRRSSLRDIPRLGTVNLRSLS
jgi:hypothetical protein